MTVAAHSFQTSLEFTSAIEIFDTVGVCINYAHNTISAQAAPGKAMTMTAILIPAILFLVIGLDANCYARGRRDICWSDQWKQKFPLLSWPFRWNRTGKT
jgi:hypothetical protein